MAGKDTPPRLGCLATMCWLLCWAPQAAGEQAKLHITDGRTVGFTTVLRDGGGYRWDLQSGLQVQRGTDYVFASGLYCHVFGSTVYSRGGQGHMNAAGDEIEIGPWMRNNITVYRRCKVYRDRPLARWLHILLNPDTTAKTVPVRIYTCINGMATIVASSASPAGGAIGPKDWAFITAGPTNPMAVLHIPCGPKSSLRPAVRTSGNSIYVDYIVTVPANGTAVLCYFASQGRSVAELKKLMRAFRPNKVLRDLPASVRKLIVNFRCRDVLEGIELERRGTGDAVELLNGDWIAGRLANLKYDLQTLHGPFELPASQVVGFVGVGQAQTVRAVLLGGQVVTGKLQQPAAVLELPTGGMLKIPFERIRQCSYQITKAKPEEMPVKYPLILLRNGDRLAFEAANLHLDFLTRHGKVELEAKDLLEIRLDREEHGLHRVRFLNGSTLAGLLLPEKIRLPLKLGRPLEVPRQMVRAIRFAAEPSEAPPLSRAVLTNDDELFGALVDEGYQLRTDFGTVPVKAANILAVAFDANDPTRVEIKLWDGTTLRGRLQRDTLKFAIRPGPTLSLHLGHIVRIRCPNALPPEHIVKLVSKYVAMLSAPSYKDRQEAQEKLLMLKAPIVPLLRKHLDDTDPEVRQRIRTILEKLGAPNPHSSTGPPPRPLFGEQCIPRFGG
ncbi:MAG: hypothetical protein B1H04_02810 [Planctomycetales bacterium 4484_123]|nr:MAG: hypothetical protein B1H04_02810 [Planctomycetales bacterium 4484_123]